MKCPTIFGLRSPARSFKKRFSQNALVPISYRDSTRHIHVASILMKSPPPTLLVVLNNLLFACCCAFPLLSPVASRLASPIDTTRMHVCSLFADSGVGLHYAGRVLLGWAANLMFPQSSCTELRQHARLRKDYREQISCLVRPVISFDYILCSTTLRMRGG